MLASMTITQSRLRELLHYDPATGVWLWMKSTTQCIKVGRVAGRITSKGYRQVTIDGRSYVAHRLAWFWMTGEWPAAQIDHRDLDKDNNRWENLREATLTQNLGNQSARRTNKLGVKGVSVEGRFGKYVAQIRFEGKQIWLGQYSTIQEAKAAYDKKSKELFGEFARAG